MNKYGKLLLSGLFIIYVFMVATFLIVTPTKETSEFENRELAQKPEISSESIISGKFMEGFESYFTDQFPGRNFWLKTYVNYQQFTNKMYVNEFHITNDNWIIPKPEHGIPKKEINTAASNVNNLGRYLKNDDTEFYYFSIPHKVSLFQFLLPNYVEKGSYNQAADYFLSQLDDELVTTVDMRDTFNSFSKEKLKELYFKTDHHWNIDGAFEGYKIIANSFLQHSNHFGGTKEHLRKDYYERACVPPSKPFLGTYNRQLYGIIESNDNQNMCTLLNRDVFSNYEVTVEGEKREPFDFYGKAVHRYENREFISYGALFAYDYGEVTITNNQNEDAGNILVLKNSYSDSIIYHIAQNFHKTVIYDPRYNKSQTVNEFIKQNDFDVVAILLNNTQIKGVNYEFDSTP